MPEMNDPCANSRLAAIMRGVGPGAKLSKGWRAEFTDAMNCCVVCCWEARGRTPTTSAKTKGIVFRKGCRSDRDFMLFLQTSIYLNTALRHLTRQGSQTQHSTRPTGDRPLAATCVCELSAGCVASLCLVTSLRRLWVLEAPELSALPPFTVRGLVLGAAEGSSGVGRFGFDFAAGGRDRWLNRPSLALSRLSMVRSARWVRQPGPYKID